jgi:hypothetical protein
MVLSRSPIIIFGEVCGRSIPRAPWQGASSDLAQIKSLYTNGMSLMLCTDLPLEAKRYFYDQN